MKILLLSGMPSLAGHFGISLGKALIVAALVLASSVGAGYWYGYDRGMHTAKGGIGVEATRRVDAHIEDQRASLNEARSRTQQHLDALAMRLGEMQSHLLRLNALGDRLVRLGRLDAEEFNFELPPAQGGPQQRPALHEDTDLVGFLRDMDRLGRLLKDRERKLELLEDLLMNRFLAQDVRPGGFPVDGGWVSSAFGYRNDPFTGERSFHNGVDIAAKADSEVKAAASGVVTAAGARTGYGKYLEIRHGNGFVTRYGHNAKLLVKRGDVVDKGDSIALVGSTGRSTGPHVHFEVALNGENVDPAAYMSEVD